MHEALQRAWLNRAATARLLWPLSQLYRFLTAFHRGLYRYGLRKTERLPVPVVVVGNVVAGGAGKTPVVLALLEHLTARGLKPGVISRGYGRSTSDTREVAAAGPANQVGDEPLLIKRRTGVPVFVSRRRADAARALLAAYPETQLLISDDGLQHHALARDIEICVFDERGVGNGWLLPAGPLRESWPRPVDLLLAHGRPPGIDGHPMSRRLASQAVRADGTAIELTALQGQRLHAVAAVANPDVFFRMLRDEGLPLAECIALPDHYAFDQALPSSTQGGTLVCTEKDAHKLWRSRPDAWAVPLQLEIAPAFWSAFDDLLNAKLSSAHGRQTA